MATAAAAAEVEAGITHVVQVRLRRCLLCVIHAHPTGGTSETMYGQQKTTLEFAPQRMDIEYLP